jgi:hypothetical protein
MIDGGVVVNDKTRKLVLFYQYLGGAGAAACLAPHQRMMKNLFLVLWGGTRYRQFALTASLVGK